MRTKWIVALTLGGLAAAGGIDLFILKQPAEKHDARSSSRDGITPLQIEDCQVSSITEFGFDGQRDFRFQNRRNSPVTLGVDLKDCQCARIQICLTPEEWKKLEPDERRKLEEDPTLTWQRLDKAGEAFTIPPRADGLLRLGWTAKQPGYQRYWARLWLDDGGSRTNARIEALVQVVQPVCLCAEDNPRWAEVNVGRLNAGEKRMARFFCYSATRPHFTLTPSRAHPCFHCGDPQPLTTAELETLSHETGARVQSGYRLTVAACERVGDVQLDIGPFRRQVGWSTDVAPGHQVQGTIRGTVQGEVKLLDATDKTSVDLGKISPNDPAPVIFALESKDHYLELSIDEKSTLDILAAELLDGKEGKPIQGGKSWHVRVRYRKGIDFRGPFPQFERQGYDSDVACSIVFHVSRKAASQGVISRPFRRLLVPVHGVVQSGSTRW